MRVSRDDLFYLTDHWFPRVVICTPPSKPEGLGVCVRKGLWGVCCQSRGAGLSEHCLPSWAIWKDPVMVMLVSEWQRLSPLMGNILAVLSTGFNQCPQEQEGKQALWRKGVGRNPSPDDLCQAQEVWATVCRVVLCQSRPTPGLSGGLKEPTTVTTLGRRTRPAIPVCTCNPLLTDKGNCSCSVL